MAKIVQRLVGTLALACLLGVLTSSGVASELRGDSTVKLEQGAPLGARHLLEEQPAVEQQQPNNENKKEEWWWLAKLEPIMTLRSHKPRNSMDVAIAMPFSLDRFEALDIMCTYAWPGIVAAAVYMPMHKGLVHMPGFDEYHGVDPVTVLQKVKKFHRQFHGTNGKGNCTLDMTVYVEDLPELTDWYGYPVNAMRNLALEIATTEIVVLLDADFVVGPFSWAHRLMNNKNEYDKVRSLLQSKSVLVLPAFKDPDNPDALSTEDSKQLVRDVVLADSKDFVLQMLDTPYRLQIFLLPHHADTDYERWRNATDIYQVTYGEKGVLGDGSKAYEPYVMALRSDLPKYDERFRGFFKNKVSYLFYLDKLGFQYHVCPDAYVVHYPHVKQDIQSQMKSEKHEMMMHIWYGLIPDELSKGIYEPVVAPKPPRASRQLMDILRKSHLKRHSTTTDEQRSFE